MILGSGTSDVLAALVTALGAVSGAGLALYGVVYAARTQKRPRIVDLDKDQTHIELAAEKERRIQAESERDVWRQVALDCQHRLRE